MISYDIIAESIAFYEIYGFKRIESPWTITQAISNITKPLGAKDFFIADKNKVLVASGEQSFLYLYNKGFLPLGKYQTVTPCFRDEEFTSLHTKYFIKNELIITDEVNENSLDYMLEKALAFFEKWIPKSEIVRTLDCGSELSYDIVYNGTELGSYGIRHCDFLDWIYGTGVAEPRLSSTIKKYGISSSKNK